MGIKYYMLWIFLSVSFISCKERKNLSFKDCGIANLKFRIPDDAIFKETQGIDNRAYQIKLDDSNKIEIQYGTTVYDLHESLPQVFNTSEREIIFRNSKYPIEEGSMVFSETAEEDKTENIYSRNYYYYDTINGLVCKLVRPKHTGKGMTGLYIRHINTDSSICMYGDNLDSIASLVAIKIFYSVKKN